MQIAKHAFLVGLSQSLPFVVSILTVPIYISLIGAERYGALAIAWILLGYFGQIDFGIGRAVIQRISTLRNTAAAASMATVIWSALASVLLFGLVGAGVVYGVAHYFFSGPFAVEQGLRGELLASVWVLALCNPLMSIYGVTAGALMGIERFKIISATGLVSGIAVQVFPLAAAWLTGPDMLHLIAAAFFARLLCVSIVTVAMTRLFLRGQPFRFSWSEMRGLTRFGVWAMAVSFVSPLMMFADRFVIGAFLGAAAVAAYTIPFQITLRMQTFPQALMMVLFPRFASESADASLARCRNYSIFIGQIFAPVSAGIICLAGPLLSLWLGDHLDDRSVRVAQILMLGMWVNAVAQVSFNYVQGRGDSRFTGLLNLCELPLYALMLVGFGSMFGLAGAAAAFSLRCLVDCLFLARKTNVMGRDFARGLAGPALVLAVPVLLGEYLRDWWPAVLAATICCGASLVFLVLQMPADIRARIALLPFARFVPGLLRGREQAGHA